MNPREQNKIAAAAESRAAVTAYRAHDQGPSAVNFTLAFAVAATLNVLFVTLEVVFGVLAHSLALIADAGHNLGDVIGRLLAWAASALSQRAPTERRTYGLRSSTILAALFNAILLLVAVGAIIWEAMRRLTTPTPVAGGTMIWVAAIGIFVNAGTALMFISGLKRDLNVRAAFLHMCGDAAVSLGVLAAGCAVVVTNTLWIDPAVSILIAAVIIGSTLGLLRDSLNLALHAVPAGIELPEVRRYLAGLPHVIAVHDLHVWPMSTTETALTAHLVRDVPDCDSSLLTRAAIDLHERFQIHHATLQLETPEHDCSLAPDESV
ncbi:MAG: cation transporter [Verrucomicrobia bacterium]|nr:MAG: cation transporter [Verrucomicrobiota bacterium]